MCALYDLCACAFRMGFFLQWQPPLLDVANAAEMNHLGKELFYGAQMACVHCCCAVHFFSMHVPLQSVEMKACSSILLMHCYTNHTVICKVCSLQTPLC